MSMRVSSALVYVLAAFVIASLILAGCGGSSGQPVPAQSKQPASAASSAAPASKAPAASTQPTPQKIEKINFMWGGVSTTQSVFALARNAGIFNKYGLDATVTGEGAGTTSLQAMMAGQVQFVASTGSAVLGIQAAGGDAEILATIVTHPYFEIWAAPNISKVEDLKGQKVGITKVGSLTDFLARFILKQYKMDAEKDVTLVQVGSTPAVVTAIKSGAVQGGIIILGSDTITAQRLGLKRLGAVGDFGLETASLIVAARKSYVDKNRDIAMNVMRTLVESIHRFKTDKPTALQAMKDVLKMDNMDDLSAIYDMYPSYMRDLPDTPMAVLQRAAEEGAATNPAIKNVDLSKAADNSFIQELDKSGFIKGLSGR